MPSCIQNAVYYVERIRTLFDGSIYSLHHAYLSAVDNGNYTLKEMLKQDDENEFITTMMKEVQDHENRDHWTMIPRTDMPDGAKSILAVWSFKRKVFPDGRVLKYKGCIDAGRTLLGNICLYYELP